ncbi:MAG: hypothetical protein AAB089_00305 [Nitrospirota bacterium]
MQNNINKLSDSPFCHSPDASGFGIFLGLKEGFPTSLPTGQAGGNDTCWVITFSQNALTNKVFH